MKKVTLAMNLATKEEHSKGNGCLYLVFMGGKDTN